MRPLLTPGEVAERLGLDVAAVRALVVNRKIPAVRLSRQTLRFQAEDVERYRTSVGPLMPVEPMTCAAHLGTVYFVASGEYVKIGFTTKPMPERMKYLQTGNPIKLELLHAILNVECSFEKVMHRQFHGACYREEWFKRDRELMHPAGDRIAKLDKFIESLAANEAETLNEFKVPWRRGA